MNSQKINELVASAVGQSFDAWAAQHPTLAAVIDHVTLTDRTVESLRTSPEYQSAIEAYHRDANELRFLSQLVELVQPILLGLLAA